MKKRLVVCLDGTWQNIVQDAPTNIADIAQSVAPVGTEKHDSSIKVPQVTYYSRGVGAPAETGAQSFWNKVTGGGFGQGLEENVLAAYIFIALNYEPGDEIYIFGFSRGAYTARSLAGMIGTKGLLRRDAVARADEVFDAYRGETTATSKERGERSKRVPLDTVLYTKTPIAYLGIFDTVGMRGIPTRGGMDFFRHNKKYGFHDLDLGEHVQAARHACAIDETRNTLPVTPWTNLKERNQAVRPDLPVHSFDAPFQQKWFAGQHGDVGGGLPEVILGGQRKPPLSDIPMRWIVDGAADQGLGFSDEKTSPYVWRCKIACEPLTDPTPAKSGFLDALGKENRVIGLWNRGVDKDGNPLPMPKNECATLEEVSMHLHPATRYRIRPDRKYYPTPLQQFLGLPTINPLERMLGKKPPVTTHAQIADASMSFPAYEAFEASLTTPANRGPSS